MGIFWWEAAACSVAGELLVLVDRGCPPQLAARILAPIEKPAP